MKILFIQTGGTIDKDYPHTTKGWAFEIGEAAAKRILEKINPSIDFEIITACQKDSLEITDEDRQRVLDLMMQSNSDKIIITHGTDTMIATATFLARQLNGKTVIITGAMRPEKFSDSDAPVNLGVALGAVQHAAPGIYIAMHGVVKSFDAIKRDLSTGKFY